MVIFRVTGSLPCYIYDERATDKSTIGLDFLDMNRRIVIVVALGLLVTACSPGETAEPSTTTTEVPAPTTTLEAIVPLAMTSPSFNEGQVIPATFTCEGPNFNPQLDIVGLPDETVTLTIIVDDPDAPVGIWDHWVEYDIDAGGGGFTIPQAAGQIGIEGLNSWNLPGYGGPCPPEGEEHRYFFTVYVLNGDLGLPPEIDSAGVRTAMEGKIITQVVLMGTFAR